MPYNVLEYNITYDATVVFIWSSTYCLLAASVCNTGPAKLFIVLLLRSKLFNTNFPKYLKHQLIYSYYFLYIISYIYYNSINIM
jgi:hypothetical protein